jgi:hypothetical protein
MDGTRTEVLLQRAIATLRQGRTRIVIARRPVSRAGENCGLFPQFDYTIIMIILHFRLAIEIGKCIR